MDFIRIGKLFSDEYFAVPDYQRDYEWTNAQIYTLLDDIMTIAMEQSSENHFFGAIVTIPYKEWNGQSKSIDFNDYNNFDINKVKHVVDGQQRLTTFSVLIKALMDVILEDEDLDDVSKDQLKRQLENLLFGGDYNENENPAPRLILNGNTGKCYNKAILNISDEHYNGVYRGAKRIKNTYSLITNEIKTRKQEFISNHLCNNSKDYYITLKNTITNKVTIVEVECDDSFNAFQVFDSLNGKGLDLTAADRIKNIFMSLSPLGKGAQKWTSFESCVGSDYLASFIVSLFFHLKGKRVSKNKLPDEFRGQYKDQANSNFDSFYNELKEAGTIYGDLRKASTGNEKIDYILQDFSALGFEQVYVILFAAAYRYGRDIISSKDYVLFASALQKFIVRLQVCDKSMNKLDALFSKSIDQMRDYKSQLSQVTEEIISEMTSQISDSQFKTDFAAFAPKDRATSEFYLRHIEDYLRRQRGQRTPVERGITVEHIIPQTLDDLSDWYGKESVPDEVAMDFEEVYIERLGNKMLLYGDDNSSANNNDYQSKLKVYINGKADQTNGTPYETFQMVKDVVDTYKDKFNHDEVNERAKTLAEYAVEIWR